MSDPAQFRNRAYFGLTTGVLAILITQGAEQLFLFNLSRDGFALVALIATAIGSSWADTPQRS